MTEKIKKHLFVLYHQNDADIVVNFIELLNLGIASNMLPVDIWIDRLALKPGEPWQEVIESAIRDSIGILFFVSSDSLSSSWIRKELEIANLVGSQFIIPVVVEPGTRPPEFLRDDLVYLNISSSLFAKEALHDAIDKLVSRIKYLLRDLPVRSPLKESDAQSIAVFTAENIRTATSQQRNANQPLPDSVFVVHGHDTDTLQLVTDTLMELGVRPVVLSQLEGSEQSLLQKFFTFSKQARFAIVILSSDDYGASRLQYEADGVADRALQFRARQNVVLELGFFYGYLGWENVFVLFKKTSKVFPNFERPSDLEGAVFDPIDEDGKWKDILARKLQKAGFQMQR